MRHTHIAVAAREGENLAQAPRELHAWLGEALQQGSLKLLNASLCKVSSTEIRRRARTGESLAGLVDRRVERYIEQNHLYR